jgi:hypothetical protein
MKMLTRLKAVAAPYKRPSAKKMAGDFTIGALKVGAKSAVGM